MTVPFAGSASFGDFRSPPTMSSSSGRPHSPSPSSSASSLPSAAPDQSHTSTTLALGISLAVVGSLVLGGLAFYFIRRHLRSKKAQERAEEISSHRRTYMVSVDPSHLAARVTPFGVGVNAPDVEVPKFGESQLFVSCIFPTALPPALVQSVLLDDPCLPHPSSNMSTLCCIHQRFDAE